MSIAIGDRAPQFTGMTHTGEQVRLADLLCKQAVVLYFYPRDGTGICTAEACAFRDAYEGFVAAGAAVIGVSRDSVERHRRFANERRLPFTLISDGDRAIERAYGVPHVFGLLPGRKTFVIDKQGFIRHVFSGLFSAQGHIDEALRVVRQLAGQAG